MHSACQFGITRARFHPAENQRIADSAADPGALWRTDVDEGAEKRFPDVDAEAKDSNYASNSPVLQF
jgi:hypothetical protein